VMLDQEDRILEQRRELEKFWILGNLYRDFRNRRFRSRRGSERGILLQHGRRYFFQEEVVFFMHISSSERALWCMT